MLTQESGTRGADDPLIRMFFRGMETYAHDKACSPSARQEEAPERFSPTSYVVWVFGLMSRTLKDDLLWMHRNGTPIIGSEIQPFDLIFRNGPTDLYHPDDRLHGIGHVGICMSHGTSMQGNVVCHASPYTGRVQADPIQAFLDHAGGRFRGVRRFIARSA